MFNVQHPTRSYILQYLTSSYHWHPGSQAQATCPLWCVMPSWHRAWPAWRISLKVASATGMRWPRCSRTIRDDPLSASKKRLHTATCERTCTLLDLIGSYGILLGSYWILLDLIGSYWILLAFCAISRCCLASRALTGRSFSFSCGQKMSKTCRPSHLLLCYVAFTVHILDVTAILDILGHFFLGALRL